MMYPIININGTSKGVLIAECNVAMNALKLAAERMRDMTIHGRDFPGAAAGDYPHACRQHKARIAKVEAVYAEVEMIRNAIDDQPVSFGRGK